LLTETSQRLDANNTKLNKERLLFLRNFPFKGFQSWPYSVWSID